MSNRRQTIPKHLRYTINDFNAQFPDDNACLEYLKEKRFPSGVAPCEKCEQDRKHHRVTGRPAYACDYCGSMISPMAGTIFEKSSTSLRLWFYAMYLMASTRCGISAKQIQRETGVTYKTAWRMFKQIRTLLAETIVLGGEGNGVEMDESYFGPKRKRGAKRGRPAADSPKQCVVGIAERNGRVVALTADNATQANLQRIAQEKILPASTVFTDDWTGYHGFQQQGYQHKRINHSEKIYVSGDVHTQTIDGFWALVKTGIRGVYHAVGKKYLQSYLDEYSFRYNRRDQGNLIFTSILERVSALAPALPGSRDREMIER
jgi:transposase-like protein